MIHQLLKASFFSLFISQAYATTPQISIADGKISGIQLSQKVEGYLGIPYALPPVGNLRWKAPRPNKPWKGNLVADKFKSTCPQNGNFFANVPATEFDKPVGNEDCLYLNVWKPTSSSQKLPVVFWIHGGSNFKGTTADPMYDGKYLASNSKVVMVSLNYRLGLLGAFSHEAVESENKLDGSGNYVTLDLIQGLKWVKENISNFGGDPDNVIIVGQSAGCMNVWGLLQSPMSEGLFHKAVCSSGLPNSYPKKVARSRSNDFVENLVVNAGLVKEKDEVEKFLKLKGKKWVRDFLYSRTSDELVKGMDYIVPFQHIEDNVVFPHGLDSTSLGNYHQVPMIIGSTLDEGTLLGGLAHLKVDHQTLWGYMQNSPSDLKFEDIMKPSFAKYRAETKAISMALNRTIGNIYLTARLYNKETYRYSFEWKDISEPWKDVFGATHGIDITFLLGNFDTKKENFARFAWTDANKVSREALREKMNKHFTQFFYTGNPGWEGTIEFE